MDPVLDPVIASESPLAEEQAAGQPGISAIAGVEARDHPHVLVIETGRGAGGQGGQLRGSLPDQRVVVAEQYERAVSGGEGQAHVLPADAVLP